MAALRSTLRPALTAPRSTGARLRVAERLAALLSAVAPGTASRSTAAAAGLRREEAATPSA
eukprot:12707688-Alexandrium_andersonii.AAC.1